MQGGGGEGVLSVLRVLDNTADAVPPEQIPFRMKHYAWTLQGPSLNTQKLRSKARYILNAAFMTGGAACSFEWH